MNTELEAYFQRIVNATNALCGTSLEKFVPKDIHDALLGYTGLTRDHPPTTFGGYMVGIAVCARYIGGEGEYMTGKSALANICEYLENPTSQGGSSSIPTADSLTGVWVLFSENAYVSLLVGDFEVSFTSNDTKYERMGFLSLMGVLKITYDDTVAYQAGWVSEAYRTIDFGSTGQTVSSEFYEWLTKNATYQAGGQESTKTCPICSVVVPSDTAVCPGCGNGFDVFDDGIVDII